MTHAAKCATHFKNYVQQHEIPRVCDCDGYHTFNELYDHRHILFLSLVNMLNRPGVFRVPDKYRAWKSKLHSNGSSYDGYFVLGMGRKAGEQITYHLPNDLWDKAIFAKELARAPKWDKHSPDDVKERLLYLFT